MIKAYFSCPQCRFDLKPIMLPERKDWQSAVEWLKYATETLYEKHLRDYPHCTGKLDLYVPCNEIQTVGKRVTEH